MRLFRKTRPDFVTYNVKDLRKYYTVNFDITEVFGGFEWTSVVTSPGDLSYGEIVAGIIRTKYDDNSMTAIINNYLEDMTNEVALKEFQDMQEWRSTAKMIAKEAILWAIDAGIYEVTEDNRWILEINDSEETEEEQPEDVSDEEQPENVSDEG